MKINTFKLSKLLSYQGVWGLGLEEWSSLHLLLMHKIASQNETPATGGYVKLLLLSLMFSIYDGLLVRLDSGSFVYITNSFYFYKVPIVMTLFPGSCFLKSRIRQLV